MTRIIFLCILACCNFAFAAEPPELIVKISGTNPAKGKVIVTLYQGSDSWLKPKSAIASQSVDPSEGGVTTQFKLSPGSYAIHAFQDENANGKLDMRWLPPGPAEPWVVSNNAQGSMGPPAYNDAKFDFSASLSLSLALQ